VLGFSPPFSDNMPALLVIGQADFFSRGSAAGLDRQAAHQYRTQFLRSATCSSPTYKPDCCAAHTGESTHEILGDFLMAHKGNPYRLCGYIPIFILTGYRYINPNRRRWQLRWHAPLDFFSYIRVQ
jgi:hypothetical protein